MNLHPSAQSGTFIIRPYTTRELADIYGVCKKTFSKWLTPFASDIGKRIGYFYNTKQVAIIIDKLGLPSTAITE